MGCNLNAVQYGCPVPPVEFSAKYIAFWDPAIVQHELVIRSRLFISPVLPAPLGPIQLTEDAAVVI